MHLHSLFRYPVKAMAGESLDASEVAATGLVGDRAYALVDNRNKVGTAKKQSALLNFRARFLDPPRAGEPIPAVEIGFPDGSKATSSQPDAAKLLSAALQHDMTLMSAAPPGLMLEFAAGTLGGKHADTTECPLASASPPGTFFDLAVVHLLTTSTLRRLREVYPQGRFETARFRPNFVVETDEPGFIENGWVGRTVTLGNEVVLRVIQPCARCVTPTLPQAGLPHDPGILRAAARHNGLDLGDFGKLPCVGVYADVVQGGVVRRGDTVRVV